MENWIWNRNCWNVITKKIRSGNALFYLRWVSECVHGWYLRNVCVCMSLCFRSLIIKYTCTMFILTILISFLFSIVLSFVLSLYLVFFFCGFHFVPMNFRRWAYTNQTTLDRHIECEAKLAHTCTYQICIVAAKSTPSYETME